MAIGALALAGVERVASHPAQAMRVVFQVIVGSFGLGFVIFGPRGWYISVKGGPAGCDGSNPSGYPPCYDTGSLDIAGAFLGTAGTLANAAGNALGVAGGSATAPATPSASSDTWYSHPNPSSDSAPNAPPSQGPVDWTYDEGLDSWVSRGLALAGAPDTPENHNWGVTLAMHESSGQPGIVQDCSDPTPPPFGNFDINCQNGNPAMGLMQIIPGTWASTTVGNAYPFDAYWDNPIVSVAVRAQNQMNYGIFPTIAGGQ